MNSPVHEVVASLLRSDGLLVGPTHPLYEAQGRVCADGVVLLVAWQEAKGGRGGGGEREGQLSTTTTQNTHTRTSSPPHHCLGRHRNTETNDSLFPLKTALVSESMVRSTDGANVS